MKETREAREMREMRVGLGSGLVYFIGPLSSWIATPMVL